jgi:cytochrome c biogenesis protein CcmG/thiol:disulfide interchange protein DsbE
MSPPIHPRGGHHVPRPPLRLAAALVASGLLLTACGAQGTDELAGPPFPARSYETLEGGSSSLQDFEGEPMVVNFFASWCPPCVAEMPDLERVHLAVEDRVRFVGLNTQDGLAAAQDLVARTGVTYDIGLDPDGELFRDFEVIAMPSTFFVDADGAIVHRHAGLLTEPQLRDLVDQHLLDGGAAV